MKTIKYFSSTFNLIFSSIVGSIIGMVTSLIVNCTLLEISMNSVFSIVSISLKQYFGVMFVIAGSLILWRNLMINDQNKSDRYIFPYRKENNPQLNTKKKFFILLSVLVILSGFTSFILDQSWFLVLNYVYKIPIYSLLGNIDHNRRSFNMLYSFIYGDRHCKLYWIILSK